MEPVLIYTDTEKIQFEKAYLTASVSHFQELYDAFKLIGITTNLNQLYTLASSSNKTSQEGIERKIKNFVIDELVKLAGNPSFGGVLINKEKLVEMLSVPDLSNINSLVDDYESWKQQGYGFRIDLMEIVSDTILEKESAASALEALYTYYTVNDAGANVASVLFTLSNSLNQWAVMTHRAFPALHKGMVDHTGFIEGLEYVNNQFRPRLTFVRQEEARK
ncbi:hypothetical protein [Pedobacter antarcticus]|uniref:hypothetical protein n=1 Tax=Pedobacter antarcticus TaxID=34086 RepID=UPI00292DF800|nr:hypothetical protein [Pedobacter antarcticus]